jgi:hypothetical protein
MQETGKDLISQDKTSQISESTPTRMPLVDPLDGRKFLIKFLPKLIESS